MSLTIFSTAVDPVAQAEGKEGLFWKNLSVLAPVALVYVLLAFYRIDHQSFWIDEVLSLNAAAPGQSFFSRAIWNNGQGPLYFALLHVWLTLGDSEFIVRSLSVVLGLSAVVLIYALGLRLGDRRFAAVCALLLATSPFFIWYSQEARYITLAIVSSLLSMYLFHHALETTSFRVWASYAIATTTALFSFVPVAFIPVAQGLYLLFSTKRRRNLARWICWQAGIFVIFGSWLLMSYGGVSITSASGGTPLALRADPVPLATGTSRALSAAVIPYTFLTFSSGFSIGPSVAELHVSRDLATLLEHLPMLAPLTLLYAILFVYGVLQLCRQAHPGGLPLPWLMMPMLGVLFIAGTTSVAYNVRYASAALPAYLVILATATTAFRRRAIQLIMLTAILFVNGLSLAQYYFNPRYAKADARGAARYLESAGDPRDVILFVGSPTAFQHYYQGSLTIIQWGKGANSSRESISKNLEDLTNRYSRLWFVAIRPWATDPKGNVREVLNQSLENIQDVTLAGVTISAYVLKKPTAVSRKDG